MRKESQSYRTQHHSARYGLAVALRKHGLSNRAARLLVAMLGEADDDGVFSRHISYAADWSEQSDDTLRHALKELIQKGLVCKHPQLPRGYLLDPETWFDGSTRQLSRHIRLFERQRHNLPPEQEPLH